MDTAAEPVLSGVRVLDLGSGIAAAYCSKLYRDAGADVVTVEPAAGDALRARGKGGLFAFLNAGKRSFVGDWTRLAAAADVVIASDPDIARRLHAADPAQVVVLVTPFGGAGPWVERPADEFLLQAWCGSTGSRGWPAEPPLAGGGCIGEFLTGAIAAAAALAALRRRRNAGVGELVDVSMLECMAISFAYYPSALAQFDGPPQGPARALSVPAVVPARDGFVVFTTSTRKQTTSFFELIERPELAGDEALMSARGRQERYLELLPMIEEFTQKHTVADLLERARELRLPVAQVCNGRTVRDLEHFRARGAWARSADGRFEQPATPFRIDGVRPDSAGPVPATGQHTAELDRTPAGGPPTDPPTATGPAPGAALPLAGLRVVDCTSFWAGPFATLLLAALGADVVHVEGPDRPDSNRLTTRLRDAAGRPMINRSGAFHALNNSKRGVVVDLKQPDGAALITRLLESADVLVENNSPRVMDGFGLGWDEVHRTNPALVMTRMSAFGLDGPWRDHVAYAFTVEALAGHAWATGWPDGPPTTIGGPADPLAGAHAAFATILAVLRRDRDGTGALVDACLAEPALNAAAEQIIEAQLGGAEPARYGNRSPLHAPQGVYPAAGDDAWIAVSVTSEAQWQALCELVAPELIDSELGDAAARWAAHDRIDAVITAWTAARPADTAVADLLAAGVPAAVVVAAWTVDRNPQLRARGFVETVRSPTAGTYEVPLVPFRYASVASWSVCPAPDFGQHTDELLDELGVLESERDRLRAQRVVVGDRNPDRPGGPK